MQNRTKKRPKISLEKGIATRIKRMLSRKLCPTKRSPSHWSASTKTRFKRSKDKVDYKTNNYLNIKRTRPIKSMLLGVLEVRLLQNTSLITTIKIGKVIIAIMPGLKILALPQMAMV